QLRTRSAPLPRAGHRQAHRRSPPDRRAAGLHRSARRRRRPPGRPRHRRPVRTRLRLHHRRRVRRAASTRGAHGQADTEPRVACTLTADAATTRIEEWQALLRHARRRATTAAGGTRIELDQDADIAELTRLVAAEQHCCSFFGFAITVDDRGLALEIEAPDNATELVSAVFGAPTD